MTDDPRCRWTDGASRDAVDRLLEAIAAIAPGPAADITEPAVVIELDGYRRRMASPRHGPAHPPKRLPLQGPGPL